MKVTALAPWFGSARQNAKTIGELIGKRDWVGIPFCGGCSEVPHIQARSILLNDLHWHIYNLAKHVADPETFESLYETVDAQLFHPTPLDRAQSVCKHPDSYRDIEIAAAYFIVVWMSRSAEAGTGDEFDGQIASRFTASGGSSIRRWRSAVEALPEWHKILRERCEFKCLTWRKFASKCHDREGHGLYVDGPWADAGERYLHKFTEQDHRDMADWLKSFEKTYVVIRHSDHPLYRELYPDWQWTEIGGRNQGNNKISECLLTQGSLF